MTRFRWRRGKRRLDQRENRRQERSADFALASFGEVLGGSSTLKLQFTFSSLTRQSFLDRPDSMSAPHLNKSTTPHLHSPISPLKPQLPFQSRTSQSVLTPPLFRLQTSRTVSLSSSLKLLTSSREILQETRLSTRRKAVLQIPTSIFLTLQL